MKLLSIWTSPPDPPRKVGFQILNRLQLGLRGEGTSGRQRETGTNRNVSQGRGLLCKPSENLNITGGTKQDAKEITRPQPPPSQAEQPDGERCPPPDRKSVV